MAGGGSIDLSTPTSASTSSAVGVEGEVVETGVGVGVGATVGSSTTTLDGISTRSIATVVCDACSLYTLVLTANTTTTRTTSAFLRSAARPIGGAARSSPRSHAE